MRRRRSPARRAGRRAIASAKLTTSRRWLLSCAAGRRVGSPPRRSGSTAVWPDRHPDCGSPDPRPPPLITCAQLPPSTRASDDELRRSATGTPHRPGIRAVARRGGEPAAGVGRYAGLRPPLQRGYKCLARRLLCDVDVTESAARRGDQAAVLLAEDPLDGRRCVLHRSGVGRAGSGEAVERTDLDLAPARL
jgi:hypothetical protein